MPVKREEVLEAGFVSTDAGSDGELGVAEFFKQEPLFLKKLENAAAAFLSHFHGKLV